MKTPLLFVLLMLMNACAHSNSVPLAPSDGGQPDGSADVPTSVDTAVVADAPVARDEGGGGPDIVTPPEPCGPSSVSDDELWYRDSVFYEIFVRSFRDSDGDGVGDLRGIIEKLDYLNDGDPDTDDDLGVTGLWLMPVNPTPSYHGYDVTNYRDIESDYGDLQAFDDLLAAAHERGIRVVIDLVLNHSSMQHPWFQDADPGEGHHDWYVWNDECLDWGKPWDAASGGTWHQRGSACYYALFWDGMPDLNYANEAVRQEALNIARFWLERGVDGFRLDAVRYLIETGGGEGQSDTPETHAFWKWWRHELEKDYPEALFVGEAWSERDHVIPYFGETDDRELHMLFDFDVQKAIEDAFRLRTAAPLRSALCGITKDKPAHGHDAPFLTNHDQIRASTSIAKTDAGRRLLATLLLTLQGSPFLYYGEEIGLPNGSGMTDEAKRQPMRWKEGPLAGFTDGERSWTPLYDEDDAPDVAAQTGDPSSLLSHYRQLIKLRRDTPALREGTTTVLPSGALSHSALLVYLRSAGDEHVVVVHNLQDEAIEGIQIELEGLLEAPGTPSPLRDSPEATIEGTTLELDSLPAKASALWTL